MPAPSHGTAVEAEVRAIAGDFGVADFVFRVSEVAKGRARREPGDGLLIVGSRGAILQVKSRDPDKIESDTTASANKWAEKQVRKARAQVAGSRREIVRRQRAGEIVVAQPERVAHLAPGERPKYDLAVPEGVEEWPGIIVIDHPKVDLRCDTDCLVVRTFDWVRLYRHLGSVSAMIRYAERVQASGLTAKLGEELDRYLAFYCESASLPNAMRGDLEFLIHPSEIDEPGFTVLNDLASCLWPADNPIPWTDPAEYRQIAQFLDEVPPGMRAKVGAGIGSLVDSYSAGGTGRGVIMTSATRQLSVCVAMAERFETDDGFGATLGGLTMLRHHQAQSRRNAPVNATLGLGILLGGGGPLEVFCYCEFDDFAADLIADLREEFGQSLLPDERSGPLSNEPREERGTVLLQAGEDAPALPPRTDVASLRRAPPPLVSPRTRAPACPMGGDRMNVTSPHNMMKNKRFRNLLTSRAARRTIFIRCPR